MAAPKENLLSLGHLTGTERNTFTKQRQNRQTKNVNRPPLLQADFSTPQSHQQLRAMHLQQHWQELKERELTAQQHNRQLLQQFEEAQDTMREMLTLTAAMKTIRMEYERYLEESSPRWQQQLKEKTQAVERKRMAEYLRSCLKNTEERVTTSSADRPFLSQVAGSNAMSQIAAPPKHYSPNSNLDYNQDGCPHLPYMHSSWQTHPQFQTARFPIRAPYQPVGSSHAPPSFLPHPHSFQLHHRTTTPGDPHPRTRQNPPGLAASFQPDYPWSWAAMIPSGSEDLWGQLCTEEPPPETGVEREDADISRAPRSKREKGGGGRSSHSSQELDIKPVRLSGGHAESSESSSESSQVSREKRKKREERGGSHHSSSDRESCSSQELSGTSSAVAIAAVTVAKSSESDASSEKGRRSTSGRTRRSGGLAAGSQRDEEVVKGRKGDDSGSHKEESQSTSEELRSLTVESRCEKAENESFDNKSESCGESGPKREDESGSVSIKIEKRGRDEIEKQESSSSEQSNDGEKQEEDLGGGEDGDAEEKEGRQTDEEERDVEEEDDEVSDRKNTTEEEEETGAEEEVEEQESEVKGDRDEEESDSLNDEDGENGKKGSVSSQDEEKDEDESEGGEEDGESDEEEQRGDVAGGPEEGSDSDDSIISPQDKSKKMHIIPEEASEDEDEEEEEEEEEEEGSKSGSSDDDSNEFSDEDDVERLLAPQEQSQKKEEKELRADETPKATCDNVERIQVQPDKSTKSDHLSDSDEFDHFYS